MTTNPDIPPSANQSQRHVAITHPDGAPLARTDPRVAFLRAAVTARAVVDAFDYSDGGLPTPCDGWTVTDLVRHIVAVYQRVAAAPSGVDLAEIPTMAEIDPADASGAIEALLPEIHSAWAEPAHLDLIIAAPWGPTPGGACLQVWAGELLIHAWDLAVSIGVTLDWPEPDVTQALEASIASLPPRRPAPEIPFDDAVATDDGASPIEKLVAWVGRNPNRPIDA